MILPSDTTTGDWDSTNLYQWSQHEVTQFTDLPSVSLAPLDSKALHVIGVMIRTFDAVGHLLYVNTNQIHADYYLHAYLIASSIIELIARCKNGERKLAKDTTGALKRGFTLLGMSSVITNEVQYDLDQLVALRNLAAHGQGAAITQFQSYSGQVRLHIELLDSFPRYLLSFFDNYYKSLLYSPDPTDRKNLARCEVEPIFYSLHSGNVFYSPIRYVFEQIYRNNQLPSAVVKYKDWQVYKGER